MFSLVGIVVGAGAGAGAGYVNAVRIGVESCGTCARSAGSISAP